MARPHYAILHNYPTMGLPAPSFFFHWHFIREKIVWQSILYIHVDLTLPNALCLFQLMGTQTRLLWVGTYWTPLDSWASLDCFCLGAWSRAVYMSKIPGDINTTLDVSVRCSSKAISELFRALQVQIKETTPGIFLPLWLRNNVLQIFAISQSMLLSQ